MGFPLIDQPSTDISRYFYIASKFIENGINSGGETRKICQFFVLFFKGENFFINRKSTRALYGGDVTIRNMCSRLFNDFTENVCCRSD